MAAPDARKLIKAPGRLIASPTDLTDDSDYGGTILGTTISVAWQVGLVHREIRGEEFGNANVDAVYGREAVQLGAVLRSYDTDAITKIFLQTTTGASSGRPVISFLGSNPPGTLGSERSFKLLFAPDNTEQHQALLFYNAMPFVDETAELAFNIASEQVVAVVFKGIPDEADPTRVYQFGLLEDLAL